jgi:hypothetical protein
MYILVKFPFFSGKRKFQVFIISALLYLKFAFEEVICHFVSVILTSRECHAFVVIFYFKLFLCIEAYTYSRCSLMLHNLSLCDHYVG